MFLALVTGELAQMVERPLCMREVLGSIPEFSTFLIFNIKQFALNIGQNRTTNYCIFTTVKFRRLALCLYLLNIPFMWAYYQGGLS